MSIVKVENLTKVYGTGSAQVVALDHVSFEVPKGQFLAIVGPSGSGKSTLLHLLGGVDHPTSGRVLIDGEDIYALSESSLAVFRRRQVGLIYQFYNLLPVLNVEENITLPLLLDGQQPDKAQLGQLVHTLGLENRLNHLPNQLSGGQQQRVSIAHALAGDPSVILADEPTGALDSRTSREVLDFLQKLNDEGNTIVLITHDNGIAQEAKRVVRVADGKIIFDGPAREAFPRGD